MNLVQVPQYLSHKVSLVCVSCTKMTPETNCFADLDGKPFKDYYCVSCAQNSNAALQEQYK